ncbi:ATP-binding protein [Streptomyces echinoruber]|uniref:ATPase AAA n=1 Tax=Streptomyces echinoruber TaxID=68898 RepID=A0A918V793_9ACTN|nr:ATP-binding protein [Streptomyces echinoruber]GGZ76579.1 ATPase AAA [Streptomyces echinoruber]
MDPNNPGPQEYGHDGDGHPSRRRPPRDSLASDFGQHAPALARTVRLVCGDHLLTVNPVDGSEIEVCPPAERPARPEKRTAAERAEAERAARAPVPPGPAQPELPLLARQEQREQLVRLLARGRSVRLVGPAGSGRTRLAHLVAEDCEDLAPDGVVRLSGFRRTAEDLLYDLFHAVFQAPRHRPEADELARYVAEIGAVVVVDDLEFGGAALDELLAATPECAFLLTATPDVPAPAAGSDVEEVVLPGLDRAVSLDLLERAAGRSLTEEEANWGGDLWFESEGLPLRFVQAGALLRQRDRRRADASAVDEFGVFQDAPPADAVPADAVPADADTAGDDPLPPLGEAAAPAPLLAARLSPSARATLRFAVALGGEVPHQAHLPALVGDTHADAALGELAGCGLVTPVGSRYRLATGVLTKLQAAGYADGAEERALTAARHYAWWAGHPSVTPERVCAEADALLAALDVLVPATTPSEEGADSPPAVHLARTAAPAFAAGLHWSAWERALRAGAEAARASGEVAEQAYFHHELGVLALCRGRLDRARAELETAIGLRGALADRRGTVAGRRALALVADRSGSAPGLAAVTGEDPAARPEEPAAPSRGTPAAFPALQPPTPSPATPAAAVPRTPTASAVPRTPTASAVPRTPTASAVPRTPTAPAAHRGRGGLRSLARRNLAAAGAGAVLVAVLGTVVTLGATSHNDADDPATRGGVHPSASQDPGDDSLGADKAADTGAPAAGRPTDPGPDGTYGTADDPTPKATGTPSDRPTGVHGSPSATPGTPSGPASPTSTKPTPRPSTPSKTPKPSSSPSEPSGSPSASSSSSSSPSTSPPATTNTAGAPTGTAGSASAPAGGDTVSPGGRTGSPDSTGMVI